MDDLEARIVVCVESKSPVLVTMVIVEVEDLAAEMAQLREGGRPSSRDRCL